VLKEASVERASRFLGNFHRASRHTHSITGSIWIKEELGVLKTKFTLTSTAALVRARMFLDVVLHTHLLLFSDPQH